eukprot:25580-Prymnesium_polylepis.2
MSLSAPPFAALMTPCHTPVPAASPPAAFQPLFVKLHDETLMVASSASNPPPLLSCTTQFSRLREAPFTSMAGACRLP